MINYFQYRLASTSATSTMNNKQQQGTTVNMTQDQDVNNYTDDGILVQHILDDLRTNVLSTGQEYDSSSLSSLIKSRYPNVTPAIVKTVIDTIFNDAENMKARVAGTFPHIQVLISARNPSFGKPAQPATLTTTTNQPSQQLQQNKPQQPPNNNTNNVQVPPAIQAKLDALSDQDKTLLQQTAISVVNDILPQIQQPIDSTELQNQIVTKYNISDDLASLCISILMLYPEYAAKIKATNQPNQNNQQQQQNQQQPNNNINSVGGKTKPTAQRPTMSDQPTTQTTQTQQSQQQGTDQSNSNNNNLGKQSFGGYASMNKCLQDQTLNHGLDQNTAVSTCSKMLQMHVKNLQQKQPGQQLEQKTASSNNNYRDMSWKELRSIIIQGPRY